jgi:hypothetical protein
MYSISVQNQNRRQEWLEMAVTRKPAKKAEHQAVDVEALIRRGGSVAGEAESGDKTQPGKAASVILRIPADVIERINQTVQARRIKTPRHTWLMEAIMEKLDREQADVL